MTCEILNRLRVKRSVRARETGLFLARPAHTPRRCTKKSAAWAAMLIAKMRQTIEGA
jgi:hypothetical protein